MLRVLITDIGHPVAPSTLTELRRSANGRIFIVGVDTTSMPAGRAFADSFHRVPDPETGAGEYVRALLGICRGEEVELVVPWSDVEAELLARSVTLFEQSNIKIMGSSFEAVRKTVDKAVLLKELAAAGLETPLFSTVSDTEELQRAVLEMGYPRRRVVVKPRCSHGSRGVWFLDSRVDLMQKQPASGITLSALLALCSEAEHLPRYLVMQYLPEPDCSVDVLAEKGTVLLMTARKRTATFGGASVAGELEDNPRLQSVASRAVRALGLDGVVNLQMRYLSGDRARPAIYEVNPRPAGTVVVSKYLTGRDILFSGILQAAGRGQEAFPKASSPAGRRFVRYWQEHYW